VVHYRHRETVYHIRVTNRGGSVSRVVCDGAEQADLQIPLRDDRQDHRVEIDLAGR
jgi:cellobiose phosphorylase